MGLKEPTDRFREVKRILDEANELIEQNTIDSLLRYFQTGVLKDDTHLPSLLLNHDKEIQILLAKKFVPIISELNFEWNEELLMESGKMVLEYRKGPYTLQFATLEPYRRTLKYHFDFEEMEREREIKLSKVKHKIKETKERYIDIKNYIEDNRGLKKLRHSKTIGRLEGNIKNIMKEISKFEEEIIEIQEQKSLLETIQSKMGETERSFRQYGFILEYVKGEEYEV